MLSFAPKFYSFIGLSRLNIVCYLHISYIDYVSSHLKQLDVRDLFRLKMFMYRKLFGEEVEEEDDDDIEFEYLEPCHTTANIGYDPQFQDSGFALPRDFIAQLSRRPMSAPVYVEETEEMHFDESKIEALVFQGGGAKGIAYCGAVKALEKKGILKKVRRFGGASAGAICAAFLAMEFSSKELEELLSTDFYKLLMGDDWLSNFQYVKYVRLLYEGLSRFGLFSTNSFHEWLGEVFEKKVKDKINETGNALPEIKDKKDITFKQVYDLFGKKELCIVVTDVCTQTDEYYHPKTTPNFPVREAVRMSMSIPFLFHPKILKSPVLDEDEYFIDGGVTCNFPVHCFDGWWLSMAEEDSFVARIKSSNSGDLLTMRTERFYRKDSQQFKTLGLRVDMLSKKVEGNASAKKMAEKKDATEPEEIKTYADPPRTKLTRKKSKKNSKLNSGKQEYGSIDELLKVLDEGSTENGCTYILRGIICNVLKKKAPKLESILRKREAVPKKKNIDKGWFWGMFSKDDTEYDDKDVILVTFEDIQNAFLEITKRPFAEWMTNIPRKTINDLQGYAIGVKEMVTIDTRKNIYDKFYDKYRTITIDTVYVDTIDFEMEMEDKNFLMFKGWKAANDFLEQSKGKDE